MTQTAIERTVAMFAGQPSAPHTCEVGLGDLREATAELARLRHEVHELKRTRSQAEAEARAQGHHDGQRAIIKQLRAYELNVIVTELGEQS